MTTIPKLPQFREKSPPLRAGQLLDADTFNDLYRLMPDSNKIQLIDGVVYMPTPAGFDHDDAQIDFTELFTHYRRRTPGVIQHLQITYRLDNLNEYQADGTLRIPPEKGGRVDFFERKNEKYITGAPELILEISNSSITRDTIKKFGNYERIGVQEYIVFDVVKEKIHWWQLVAGSYELLTKDAGGTICSRVFPGLWLDTRAMLANDIDGVIAVLDQGLATPEHAAFAAQLAR